LRSRKYNFLHLLRNAFVRFFSGLGRRSVVSSFMERFRESSGVMRQKKRNAPGSVPRRVKDYRLKPSPVQDVALFQQLIHIRDLGRRDTQERRLHIHRLIKRQVVPVHQHGRTRVLVKFAQTAHMIDVRVGADNGFHNQPMTPNQIQDARDFVSRVHHKRFARRRIANDRAVALQHSHWNGDVNQSVRCGVESSPTVTHVENYITAVQAICGPWLEAHFARLIVEVAETHVDMASPAIALNTPLGAMHAAAGAKMGVWLGCAIPDDFGDPAVEYRYARENVALIDKNYRAYLEFTGPDRVRYLNAILTNNIKDLREGHGVVSLLLNPQGHILAEIETYAFTDRLFGVSYAMIRERLIEWLDKYIIMDDVTLTDETARCGALALEGPKAAAIVQETSGVDITKFDELSCRDAAIGGIHCRLIKRSPGEVAGAEFVTETPNLPELWRLLSGAARDHGGGPMGYTALSGLRLAQGVPWFGYDFGEKQIPHEAGLQDSHISYTKGCYTGQEIVERVRSRGQVNRQRVRLFLSGNVVPEANMLLTLDGKEVGYVTRAARTWDSDSPRILGMAYVRKEAAAPRTVLQWATGTATVTT
jgi:folate-binding protein YgfZ